MQLRADRKCNYCAVVVDMIKYINYNGHCKNRLSVLESSISVLCNMECGYNVFSRYICYLWGSLN